MVESKNDCFEITIDDLIKKEYFETKDIDNDGHYILKNDVTGESLNNEKVWIYKKNNRIYAEVKYDSNK